jgi:hypothetical protein
MKEQEYDKFVLERVKWRLSSEARNSYPRRPYGSHVAALEEGAVDFSELVTVIGLVSGIVGITAFFLPIGSARGQ